MFDKEAIEKLTQAESISAATSAIDTVFTDASASSTIAALPSNYTLHELEKYLPMRRRIRGHMATRDLPSFAEYVHAHSTDAGTSVFIDPETGHASAVLDLGSVDAPGHCSHTADWKPEPTPEFKALLEASTGNRRLSQKELAEWMEDWATCLQCFDESGAIEVKKAIGAVRRITIDTARRDESAVQALSTTRSAFEHVAASSKDPLPTFVYFTCRPYHEATERTYVMRLSVLTGDDKIKLSLHHQRLEEHQLATAVELTGKVRGIFERMTDDVTVLIGLFHAK